MRKKLKSSGGLTLVEMLCAVIILILLSLMLNTGLHMAMKSYRDITAESETQLLLCTLADAISGELRYAQDVTADDADGSLISYNGVSFTLGTDHQLYIADSAGGMKRLLPAGAYRHGKYALPELPEITYIKTPNGNCYFTVKLKVKDTEGDISADAELTVRCLNPPKKEGAP